MEDFKLWIKKAGIRAVKTVAQTAVALIPASATIKAVDWKVVVSTALLAGIVSLLTSVKGLPEVDYANAEVDEDFTREDTDRDGE